jgi:hypothetical protein
VGAPAVETRDDDDPFGGDPDLGAGIGTDPSGSGLGSAPPADGFGSAPAIGAGSGPGDASPGEDDPHRLGLCLALVPASISMKVAFCDSLPRSDMQARCMSHRWSRVEWTGWCYFEFTD